MAKTFAQLTKEIAALQRKADKIRETERAGVVTKIKDAISVYGLTAADLGLGAGGARRGRKPGARAAPARTGRTDRPAKFRDASGNTWSGLGKRPNWFKEALATGKSEQDLRVS